MIVLIPMNYVIETWEWEKLENYEVNELEIGIKSVDLKLVDGFLISDKEILDNFRK